MNKLYLIYKHTSPSGKSYIGQTNNYIRRTKQHNTRSECSIFYKAIEKYGWDTFIHEILFEELTIDEANSLEEWSIKEHNTLTPNGYNLLPGGLNKTQSNIHKQNISKSLKGKVKTEEHLQKIVTANRGKTRTNEQKQVYSLLKKGISKGPHTEQTKLKISLAKKGKPSDKKGIPKTQEHKLKISLAKKGQPSSIKGRKRIINPETGKREYYFPISE